MGSQTLGHVVPRFLSRAAGRFRGLLARRTSAANAPQSDPDGIDLARAYVDDVVCTPEEISIHGWMLHPDREITALRVSLNGGPAVPVPIESRPDLAEVFPWIPHARQSGVNVRLPRPEGVAGRADLVGCHGDRPVTRMSILYRADLDTAVPPPPEDLMYRVAHVRDGRCFKVWGLKCYGDFLDFIRRHCDARRTRRLLDWGCGCGRVTAHFLADGAGPETFGCDVDGEAVAWCNENLRAGRFTTIAPFPPTPYPDASFDLILAYSVFTHLSREVQDAWLEELRRLLAPGGVVVATVMGEAAAAFSFPGRAEEVLAGGVFDSTQDTTLGAIVPAGYYRGTFQAQAYTLREWARHFDILEYRVRGIGNHQDAVVMRRRA